MKLVGIEEAIMAHSCPDCDQICHCNGDWDDCIIDVTTEQERCEHWRDCQSDDKWLDDLDEM